MISVQVIFIAFISIIAFSMVCGGNVFPNRELGILYGCKGYGNAFCDKVCKMHLARGGGRCGEPNPVMWACECIDIDEDNGYFLNALEKQCPLLKG
uniref:Lipolysis-activating peptide 1-beta chain n=1 Tax=Buthus occitanus tunetanus TaxID=6871 RepID=LV1B_BUTOC|nr:RecName: Full=Lipolysis-activating peptide 1-beta chain; Short=BotLVP1-beta; Short=LVP1-beta; Flags: Precursor [Buthus occitanus tunetanus]